MRAFVAAATLALLAGCASPRVAAPPEKLALDPFYTKWLDAGGIPISSSAAVPDAALTAARSIVVEMLARRPDPRRALVAKGQRVAVMGTEEQTLDLPEQRDWKKPAPDDPRLTFCERKHYEARIGRLTDRDYWNRRARGMGGLLTSAATENLLGLPSSRYYGENIFVHEFAHAVLDAVETADPALYRAVADAYADAMAQGRWKGEYGATTVQEYWAEGTQYWFESNKLAVVDGQRILSAAGLAAYDPALAATLRRVYGERRRLRADAFWRHPARMPPGGPPASTAEVC